MAKEKETFRVFIGTYLEDKSCLENYDKFKSALESCWQLRIRWVAEGNIHFTWKFLGDITQNRIDRVIKSLESCTENFQPMDILFDPIEIWPKKNSPRQLVWRGNDLNNNISDNFKIMEKTLKDLGFPPEKRSFKPHLTLGRFKNKGKLDSPLEMPSGAELPSTNIAVRKISIIKSDLLPSGPVYTIIKDIEV